MYTTGVDAFGDLQFNQRAALLLARSGIRHRTVALIRM